MQVFLSHSTPDKGVVEPVAAWLASKGLRVWFDKWSMTPGDSLVDKVGEGIESSDRLVVFLSPHSVDSNWVRKEVSNGLIMEIAEEKGLGQKFVVPALILPCKVPLMLRDKLYADFTNKAFDAACEELYRGITNQPLGPQNAALQNAEVRQHRLEPLTPGKHATAIEFSVVVSPTEGVNVGVDLGVPFTCVVYGFGPPRAANWQNSGGQYTLFHESRGTTAYTLKFQNNGVTSRRSFYLYFEGDEPFPLIKACHFLDFYGNQP